MGKLLLLDDGRPGHLNQSLAFARLLGCDYEVLRVGFPGRLHKACSYLFGAASLYVRRLFTLERRPEGPFRAIVSAGTDTYYANLTLARELGCPAIAVMLPRGYRYRDFTRIVAQEHDRPPARGNILSIPVNLSCVRPQGIFHAEPGVRYAALIVGGPNRVYTYDRQSFGEFLESLFRHFPDHRLLVTTSRRTPAEIDRLLDQYPFAARYIYSRDPVNPIPDFLAVAEHLFITADSTSMISEAVAFGHGCVDIVPLRQLRSPGKYGRMIARLSALGCLHVYDGTLGSADRKLDLSAVLKGMVACA